jgi:PadR family transcriptional regulator, regulatory protein PadR
MTIPKDLVAASATPLILSILAQGESYGYAIIKRVRELSGGQMQWTDGMLYPVLHRLERQALIHARWETSKGGRKRKYYSLRHKGVEELRLQKCLWVHVYETLRKSWEEKPCSI